MRAIVTGFGPFPGLPENPAQLLVERLGTSLSALRDLEIVTRILPTEYLSAAALIRQLIVDLRPEAVVCLGTAAARDAINLERVALNLNDAAISDNAGLLLQGRQIAPDGPAAYWSTLPLERMHAALIRRNLPVSMSNHAGTYVCNHVFYVARHQLDLMKSEAQCGLIHVPLASEVLPMAMLGEAIDLCLRVLTEASAHRESTSMDSGRTVRG